MNVQFDYLAYGLAGVEYALQLDGAPHAEISRRIEGETREAAGGALLTAIALAKRGARVALCGNAIGADSNGRLVLQTLETHGIEFFGARDAAETPYWVRLCAPAQSALLTRVNPAQSTVDFDRTLLRARVVADDGYYADSPAANWAQELGAKFVANRRAENITREITSREETEVFAAHIWSQINSV